MGPKCSHLKSAHRPPLLLTGRRWRRNWRTWSVTWATWDPWLTQPGLTMKLWPTSLIPMWQVGFSSLPLQSTFCSYINSFTGLPFFNFFIYSHHQNVSVSHKFELDLTRCLNFTQLQVVKSYRVFPLTPQYEIIPLVNIVPSRSKWHRRQCFPELPQHQHNLGPLLSVWPRAGWSQPELHAGCTTPAGYTLGRGRGYRLIHCQSYHPTTTRGFCRKFITHSLFILSVSVSKYGP